MAKGGRPGGGGRVSVSAATKVFNTHKNALASGKPPETITVGGTTMKLNRKSEYTSNGGYKVHMYQYSAPSAITRDGRNSLSIRATSYTTQSGGKASGYERRGPHIFGVEITGSYGYSSGSSGGIGRR